MILAEANATGEVFSLPQLWLIIAVAVFRSASAVTGIP